MGKENYPELTQEEYLSGLLSMFVDIPIKEQYTIISGLLLATIATAYILEFYKKK